MKHRVLIGVMAAVLLSACHRPVETVHAPSPHLVAIDSLMQSRPDSALEVLMDYTPDSLHDGHYAQLLASELLYKNYYAQTNRPELLEAMAYFDSIGDPFLSARCHYMNGVGYYEMDSVVPACEEYLKALEIMEDHYKEEELTGYKAKFMALVYVHLSELFSDQYLHEQTIYFGTQSLSYYDRYDAEPWHVAWIMNEIGSQYDIMEQKDSAEYYYHKAEETLENTNDLLRRDIATHCIYLSYEKGEDYQVSTIKMHEIANQAENENEYSARCLTIGEIFYCEQMFDSALVYMNYVFENTENIDSKKLAAKRLAEICQAQVRDTVILEYTCFLASFADQEETAGVIKARLTKQYDSFVLKEFDRHYSFEKKAVKRLSLLTICGLLGIILLVLILYHKNKNRKRELEIKIEEDDYAHKLQQAALSGKLKKSNEALRKALKEMEEAAADKKRTEAPLSYKKDYLLFVQTPICSHILETARCHNFKSKVGFLHYKKSSLSKEQLVALRSAADEYMGGFTDCAKKRFPSLTDEDITYCCLYMLGLNEADVSALMQRAYPTVCERKRKIRRIIGENNDLNIVLRNL